MLATIGLSAPIQITATVFESQSDISYSTIENDNEWKTADFNIIIHDVNFNVDPKLYAKYKIDSGNWIDFNTMISNDYYVPITTEGVHIVYFNFRNTNNLDLNFYVNAFLGKTAPTFYSKSPANDITSVLSTQTVSFDFNSLTPISTCEMTLIDNDTNATMSIFNVNPISNGNTSFTCLKQYLGLGIGVYRVSVKATNSAGLDSNLVDSNTITIIAEQSGSGGGGGGGGSSSVTALQLTYPSSTSVYLTGTQRQSFTIAVKNISNHSINASVVIDSGSYGTVVARTPKITLNAGESKDIVFDVQSISNDSMDSTITIGVDGSSENYQKLFHIYYSDNFLTALFSGITSGAIVGDDGGVGGQGGSSGILLVVILAIVVLGLVFLKDKKKR